VKGALKALYFLGLLAQVAIRLPHERRRGRTRVEDDRVGGLERSLVGLIFVGNGLFPAIYALTPWLDGADYRLPSRGTRWRAGGWGVAVMVAALWLFRRSHADLGRNWSPSLQIYEGHGLVTEGVYRYVRHPMYASQWLWCVGQALVLQNWIAGWAGLATFAPFYALRVPREERMMLDRFGGEYRAYMSQTGRVIPRFGGMGR
jgi:protein-S-isoprenylcysteine O-methyltransferase Ste14